MHMLRVLCWLVSFERHVHVAWWLATKHYQAKRVVQVQCLQQLYSRYPCVFEEIVKQTYFCS